MPGRSPGVAGAAAAFLVALLLLPGLRPAAAATPLAPGTEVFAVAPEAVQEVRYRSVTAEVGAQRRGAGFTLTCRGPGAGGTETCRSGPGFDAALAQLTSLKLVRTPEAREVQSYRKYPAEAWAQVLIRDSSALEPFTARLLPLAESLTEAVAQFGGATYVVRLEEKVFRLLEGGCATLGAASGP